MRGVGDESPLGFEGSLQPAEQLVEGVAELVKLVVGSLERESLVQVGGGDLAGGGGHRAQRAQHAPRDQPAERGGDGGHDRQGDDRLDHELVKVRDPLAGAHDPGRGLADP